MSFNGPSLLQTIDQGGWISLTPPGQVEPMVPEALLPDGSGVLISSGGSTGGRQVCLQPWSHLDQSAVATARWLEGIGLDPSDTVLLNPLPMHHVSGLMPWWRSRCWGAPHVPLTPSLMKSPAALMAFCKDLPDWGRADGVVSLVPTQLHRLMADPCGLTWLQACAVIWVGGAALPTPLADQARSHGLRLAPCYGATETAAMVAALTPEQFLAGSLGCGTPLDDVELAQADDGALLVKTGRLAIGRWCPRDAERLHCLSDAQGWWRSGDAASLQGGLVIHGRLDGAIHSGGETVFPEQLEHRLMQQVNEADMPIQDVLLLASADVEWGARLVALVRFKPTVNSDCWIKKLQTCCSGWCAAERPKYWVACPELTRNAAGKWQRDVWEQWLIQSGALAGLAS